MGHIEEADGVLTALRLKLSKIEQILSAAKESLSRRRETNLAYTSLQMTAMWLGKTKGSLGIKSPYPASFDPNSAVIEKRADTVEIKGEEDLLEFGISEEDADEVSVVKALRKALNTIEGEIWSMVGTMNDKPKFQLCINEAYVNCCNTTMWLGMTLNEVKKEQDKVADDNARAAAIEAEKEQLPVNDLVPNPEDLPPSIESFPELTVNETVTVGPPVIDAPQEQTTTPVDAPTETPEVKGETPTGQWLDVPKEEIPNLIIEVQQPIEDVKKSKRKPKTQG